MTRLTRTGGLRPQKARSSTVTTVLDAGRAYERLKLFLDGTMSMSHVYQPVMIKTILAGGGAATRRQIAGAFLAADLSQLEYYEEIAKGYPTQTLKRHGIIDHSRGVYRLAAELSALTEWERTSLIALCDAKVADYVAARQDAIWKHRAQNFDPIPGSIRYEVLKRAMGRCEACGVTNKERALQVDHIIPRSQGGSNDIANFQALCSTCNIDKHNRDVTDFMRSAHASYAYREPDCPFCELAAERMEIEHELAFVTSDQYPVAAGHKLLVPRRHVVDYLDLHQPEINAIYALLRRASDALRNEDPTIAGLNIGVNCGEAAGQTVLHCHIHVIPRRVGDVTNPRGGVRGVIPEKQSY